MSRDEIAKGAFGLRVEGVSVRKTGWRRQTDSIISGIDLDIRPGTLVAVIGGSGAGKSTLLRALGVRLPDSGQVYLNTPGGCSEINSENLDALHYYLSFVPQQDHFAGGVTLEETLREACVISETGGTDIVPADRITALLRDVELSDNIEIRKQEVDSLSGGQKRRLSIARALASNPRILLLDEPTSGLDIPVADRLMEMLRALCDSRKLTIVCTSHSPSTLSGCDRVLVMGIDGDKSGGTITGDYDQQEFCSILEAGRESVARLYQGQSPVRVKLSPAPALVPLPPPERERGRWIDFKAILLRSFRTLSRDRWALLMFILQPLLLAAVVVVTQSLHERIPERFTVFFLSVCAIWIGMSLGIREFVVERKLYALEEISGLRRYSYFLAKAVYTGISALTGVALLYTAALIFSGSVPEHLFAGFLILGLAGISGALIGLLISAVSSTERTALSLMPLALLPQVVFSKYSCGYGGREPDETGFPYQALHYFTPDTSESTLESFNFWIGLAMTTRHSVASSEIVESFKKLNLFCTDFAALGLLCGLQFFILFIAFSYTSKRATRML